MAESTDKGDQPREMAETVEQSSKSEEKADEKNIPRSLNPKRKIIIDPALILFFMIQISSYTLAGQYIYYAIGERHNLTAVLEAERGGNGSQGEGGACGSATDTNSSAYRLQQTVQAETATFTLYLDLVTEIPGFFVVLFFGTLMDKFGRRPTLLIPLVGVSLRALVYLLQTFFNLPLEVIAVGHFLDTMCGGISTFFSTCFAYLADTVDPSSRGRRMAIVDVGQTIALAGLQIGMGFMIKSWGFMWPWVLILGGHLVNLIYIGFFVPESRPPQSDVSCKSVSPMYIVRCFKVIPKKRPNNGRTLLLIFMCCWFVTQFGTMARHSIENLYKLNSPFCWESTLIGSFNGIYYIMTCATQMFLAVVVLRRIGDIGLIFVALLSWIGYFVIQAAATTSWMLFLAAFVGAAAGIQMPLMRGKFSQLVNSEEQGALFSTIAAADNLLRIAGSAFFNPLYGYTLVKGLFKGTVFLVMAGIVAISFFILIIFQVLQKKAQKKINEKEMEGFDNDAFYTTKL